MRKIIITGGSGFLGTQITKQLLEIGAYDIVIMDIVPPKIKHQKITFFKKNLLEPFNKHGDFELLEKPYAVIHLSGKSIYGRFTEEHKKLIRDTRVNGTKNLVDLLSRDDYKPQSLIAASAVGYYGNQPGEILVESSARENYYFLSDVVEAWEDENLKLQEKGVNVTCIRNGHIIGQGGILAEVASTFKLGFGGILGNGHEYFPWIDIRDLVNLYITCLDENIPPIINGVSTSSNTQRDFAQSIGGVKKPLFYVHVREWMLRIKFGDFAQEMLVDQHIQSEEYTAISFTPKHDTLDQTVHHYLTLNNK